MANQEQLNTVATPEAPKVVPETIEKPAPQFEGVVEEKLAKLVDFDLNNENSNSNFR